jgi:hypothetical protein
MEVGLHFTARTERSLTRYYEKSAYGAVLRGG